MDSSNNGANKIAPLEIEALETISSNLEKGNKNVPATFSKTENSSVQKISDVTDNETDSIHYITWLFGILLTCTALLGALIVPWHNALKEPFYVYEYYVFYAPFWIANCVGMFIMQLEYWAGIKYDKKINLFFFLMIIGGVSEVALAISLHMLHVYYYELSPPLPHGQLIIGTLCLLVFVIPILFFRYYYALGKSLFFRTVLLQIGLHSLKTSYI